MRRSCLKHVFALITLFISLSSLADELLNQAQAMLSEGKSKEAYALLKPHAVNRAGESDFDYLLGIAAVDSDKVTEGIFALERVVEQNPNRADARAELARAYFKLGDKDAAKKEFEKVKESSLPPAVEDTVNKYLAAIEYSIEPSKSKFNFYVEAGVGHDSNANSATSDRSFALPALSGLSFTIGEDARELESTTYDVNVGMAYSTPINSTTSFFSSAKVDHRFVGEESDFDKRTFDANAGLQWVKGKNTYRARLLGQHFSVGDKPNRELLGGAVEWQHTVDPYNQTTVFLQGNAQRFPDQESRSINSYLAGVAYAHVFQAKGSPVLFLSAFNGVDHALNEEVPGIHRDFFGARIGMNYTLNSKTLLDAAVSYQDSQYDDNDGGNLNLFLEEREDENTHYILGLRHEFASKWSVRPELRFTDNKSNQPITNYDRFEASIKVRRDF